MTSTEVQAVRRAITLLCSLIDEPQGSAGIPRRSPVWRFVQEYLVAEASADLTCKEAWQFFLEIVKANELPPTRKAIFLRQLPSLMESAFHVRKCHHIWRGGRRVRGESFSVSDLKEFTQRRGYIRDEARPGEITLREVLLREWEIVQTAKEGVGDCLPLVSNPRPANPQLDNEQRQALESLLRSTNGVSVFRGGAGTGKSFVLRELVEQLRQSGRGVVVLAPQRQQVVEM